MCQGRQEAIIRIADFGYSLWKCFLFLICLLTVGIAVMNPTAAAEIHWKQPAVGPHSQPHRCHLFRQEA